MKHARDVRAFAAQGGPRPPGAEGHRSVGSPLCQMLDSHAKLAKKLAGLEAKYDEQFRVVFEVLNELFAAPEPKRKPTGFSVKERRARYSARVIRHS